MSEYASTSVQAVLDLLDENEEALPKTTRTKVDKALGKAAAVMDWTPPTGPSVAECAAAAVADGRQPAEDPAVLAALASADLVTLERAIQLQGAELFVTEVDPLYPAMVQGLVSLYARQVASPTTDAAASLAEVGITPDTEADAVVQVPGAGDLYLNIQDARAAHARITSVYLALRSAMGHEVTLGIMLWVDPASLGLMDIQQLQRMSATPWSVVHAGCVLGLTDEAGVTERQVRAASTDEAYRLRYNPVSMHRRVDTGMLNGVYVG